MKTILTYGTFDLFHVGHARLLKRVRALGDRLIVGCSTDEFNSIKGKTSVFSFDQRVEILEACRHVDAVIPETCWEQKLDDIRKYSVNTFVIGDDWAGKFDSLSDAVEVFYIPRTDGISTTDIRSLLTNEQERKVVQIRNLISSADKLLKSL